MKTTSKIFVSKRMPNMVNISARVIKLKLSPKLVNEYVRKKVLVKTRKIKLGITIEIIFAFVLIKNEKFTVKVANIDTIRLI